MPITVDQIYNQRERFYRNQPNRGFRTNKFLRREIYQAEYLSELDPEGHRINDNTYYENILKEVPILDDKNEPTGKKKIVETPIERVSVPLQKVILQKHLTHLCGEKVKFIHHNLNPSDHEHETFIKFKNGWEKRNMETAKYEFCQSIKATGDAAFCAVRDNKTFSYRVFSVLKGDGLHPIRDSRGNLRLFGRSFTAYDFERQEEVPYLEIWDDKYCTLLTYSTEGVEKQSISWDAKTFKHVLSNTADTDGWYVVDKPKIHGFTSIPIEYLKCEEGACWSGVQDLIDKLELALSQLFENNKSYAFRIMLVKGDVEITGDLRGQARALLFDNSDGDAKFMEKADASSSFELQLRETLKYILMGSFTVLPPENTNGDLPSVSIKLLYSPALEQGLNDKNFYNKSIDKIVSLFKEGFAIEEGNSVSDFEKLDVRGDLDIYIHQNDSEVTNNLVMGVTSGFTSIETAQENSIYAAADELNRLKKQKDQELKDEREKISFESANDGMNNNNTQRKIVAKAT
ncbi:SPP1 Gp6-like portal protein [Dysgonomonas alginatilytica]|uniref:SPP1 Gp6-like portal protein n=1 Tax=Dysgonomonas alginatilytica TaxID=1605892 RepID=A0A2V3PLA3_9BACT|nr:phage portal protein [Dysgonomonas alginatilytica]PXV62367.1 SPP1 Gp6-like portal protein [Dysgonomonas alginatilytica]